MAAEPIDLHTSIPDAASTSSCACGHADESEIVLDVRQIPHAIRHATIFGALGAIAPGFTIDLVADHDPLPLLSQLEERQPGQFEVSYRESGPEVWRLHLARQR